MKPPNLKSIREGDAGEDFNQEYLQKSVAAYQQAVTMFNDDAFLPGIR